MNNTDELKSYLLEIYTDIVEMDAITAAEGPQFDKIDTATADVLDQFFIDTATWGLEKYEKLLEITTDLSKPYEERRSMIKSKMRLRGKLDRQLIEGIAAAFTDGEVEVKFDGKILIIFKDSTQPLILPDFMSVFEEVNTSHLDYYFGVQKSGEIGVETASEKYVYDFPFTSETRYTGTYVEEQVIGKISRGGIGIETGSDIMLTDYIIPLCGTVNMSVDVLKERNNIDIIVQSSRELTGETIQEDSVLNIAGSYNLGLTDWPMCGTTICGTVYMDIKTQQTVFAATELDITPGFALHDVDYLIPLCGTKITGEGV